MQWREWRQRTGKRFQEISTGSHPHITPSSPACANSLRSPFPQCVSASSALATPRNQIPSQPHVPLSSEASGSLWAIPTLSSCGWGLHLALSGQPSARCSAPHLPFSSSENFKVGRGKRMVCSGAGLLCVTSWLPQLGKYLTSLGWIPPP